MKKILLLILPLMFFISGCGGGSTVENPLPVKPSSTQMAKISEDNSDNIAIDSFKTLLGTKNLNNITNISARVVNPSEKNLKNIRALFLRLINKRVVDGYCDNSGIADINKISDSEAEIRFNNCEKEGAIYNGYAKVIRYNNTAAKVIFKNLNVYNSSASINIKRGEFLVDDNRFEIKSFYAEYKNSNERVDYLNFNSTTLIDENNQVVIINVEGYIKTNCTKGYIYLKTLPELKLFSDESGYIEGILEISSLGKKITLEFLDDSVQITDIDGVTTTLTLDDFYNLEDSLYCE